MRKLLAGASALAIFVALAIPASASSANPCQFDQNGNPTNAPCQATMTLHGVSITMPVTPLPCPPPQPPIPGGLLSATYNAVFHINVNSAGDFWATSTMEGPFTFVPAPATGVTYSGHIVGWFGFSSNNLNSVNHFTLNLTARGTDGSSFSFHETAHISFTPAGQASTPPIPQVFFNKVTC